MIFHAYLTAYFFWLALALGCLSILMLHNLAGGYWGAVIRRPLEAASTTLPLLALLFIPILIGMPALYPWVHGELTPPGMAESGATALDLTFKQAYLSTPFFVARAVVYFLIWIVFALLLVRWSRQRDADPSPALTGRLRALSAAGLVLMALTVTFAGIDWLMSLDPAWTSSIWGLIVATGALLTGFAFAVLVVALRANRPPFDEVTSPALFNSLGSLMLAFLMLWAYMAISQVILFYAGNLPEETIWYVRRTTGGWVFTALGDRAAGLLRPLQRADSPARQAQPPHPGRGVCAPAGRQLRQLVLARPAHLRRQHGYCGRADCGAWRRARRGVAARLPLAVRQGSRDFAGGAEAGRRTGRTRSRARPRPSRRRGSSGADP